MGTSSYQCPNLQSDLNQREEAEEGRGVTLLACKIFAISSRCNVELDSSGWEPCILPNVRSDAIDAAETACPRIHAFTASLLRSQHPASAEHSLLAHMSTTFWAKSIRHPPGVVPHLDDLRAQMACHLWTAGRCCICMKMQ